MTNKVFYCESEVLNITNLPSYLNEHAKTIESKFAWSLLIKKYREVFSKDLPIVSFESNGKPIIEGGFISLSHSNNHVAIAFSCDAPVGVDVELIKEEIPPKTASFLGENKPPNFYKKWTMREAVIKAKNYSALKRGVEEEFIGLSNIIYANKKAFSLSVYSENAEFIKI